MNREEYLELSNSKSLVGTQSTAVGSAAKFSPVDKLVEDQDSMTFSDVFRGDMFKTPQKSCYELFALPKGSPPTKSEIKDSLNEHIGKRTDFEKQFLDSHIDHYLARVCAKRSKQQPSRGLTRQAADAGTHDLLAFHQRDLQHLEQPSFPNCQHGYSTKPELSRQKLAKDTEPSLAIDHKALFERIGNSYSESQELNQKSYSSRFFFQPRFSDILDEDHHPLEGPCGVSNIVSLCQNISAEALSIIQSIREVRKRAVDFCLTQFDHPLSSNDNSSPCKDLEASSESISLKNFPSSTRRSSAHLLRPEELPEPLFSLYNKFCRLDAFLLETLQMGRLSLWESLAGYLQRTFDT